MWAEKNLVKIFPVLLSSLFTEFAILKVLIILTVILINLGTFSVKKHLVSFEELITQRTPKVYHIKIMANSGSCAPVVTKFICTGGKKNAKHTHTQ